MSRNNNAFSYQQLLKINRILLDKIEALEQRSDMADHAYDLLCEENERLRQQIDHLKSSSEADNEPSEDSDELPF